MTEIQHELPCLIGDTLCVLVFFMAINTLIAASDLVNKSAEVADISNTLNLMYWLGTGVSRDLTWQNVRPVF